MVLVLKMMKSTLFDYMTKLKAKLSEDQVKRIFKMIVKGLQYCHAKRIIHCDLKPENILVNYDEETMEVLELSISDFGLYSKAKVHITGYMCKGSMPYIAPELLTPGATHDG